MTTEPEVCDEHGLPLDYGRYPICGCPKCEEAESERELSKLRAGEGRYGD